MGEEEDGGSCGDDEDDGEGLNERRCWDGNYCHGDSRHLEALGRGCCCWLGGVGGGEDDLRGKARHWY